MVLVVNYDKKEYYFYNDFFCCTFNICWMW